MKLIIDIGNTTVKIAVFKKKDILLSEVFESLGEHELTALFGRYPGIRSGIVSSVRENDPDLLSFLKNRLEKFILLGPDTALPFRNSYKTPESLGYDRIANMAAAHDRFPGEDALVIDAGSAITYDFISSGGEYKGGNISPGVIMRARALKHFTSRLPLIQPQHISAQFGSSTSEAIENGILLGVQYEIEGYIQELKVKIPEIKVILTGGDAKRFERKVKNIIFVDSNFNLRGLNRILDYNAI